MIDFDRWSKYCLNVTEDGGPGVGFQKDQRRVEALPARDLLSYIPRFLQSVETLAAATASEQLGHTLWFLFGEDPGYVRTILTPTTPPDSQLEFLLALRSAYDLFDRVCCLGGTDPEGRHFDSEQIDGAVYMLWDISGLAEPWTTPSREQVDKELWLLLDSVFNCRTSTCIVSAIHALGHMQKHAGARVTEMIDRKLAERELPLWVRDYALRARVGHVE